MAGHALNAPAVRRDRAFTLLIGGQCGNNREAAAALFAGAARGLRSRGRPCRAGAAPHARAFFFVGFERGAPAGARLDRQFLCDFVGLAPGLFVVLTALFFIAFARLRPHPFGAISFLPALTDAGFLFGDLALFRLAQTCIGQRVGARATLLFSQCAQNDAGRLGRGGRRRGSGGSRRSLRGRGSHPAFRRCAAFGRGGGLGFGFGRTNAPLHLFDDNRLAASVAEALAHHALLDAAALQRQRLRRTYAQLFAGAFGRLSHTLPFLYAFKSSAGVNPAQHRQPGGADRRPETVQDADNAPKRSR